MTYGYVRVSSRDQNEERQMIAMQDFGVEKSRFIWTSNPARTLNGHSIKG